MNAITAIHPYKHKGMWVFDDDDKGLVKEPFVAGADVIIEDLSRTLSNPEAGFTLLFSHVPFPGHQATLEWIACEHTGNWYYCVELNKEGWLCPALLKYFSLPPKMIYVQFKEN